MILACLLLVAAPVTPPVAASSQPAITKETRPELFADEPPARPNVVDLPHAQDSSVGFWLGNLLRTIAVLGIVVLLAYLILNKGLGRLMKLTGVPLTGRHMTVIERLALDQKHSLFLVEVSGRRIVVGTSEHATTLVATIDNNGTRPSSALTEVTRT